MKLLFISLEAPYDNIGHAGGKTFNFYIKHFSKQKDCDVSCICYCNTENVCKIDLNSYNIPNDILQFDVYGSKFDKVKLYLLHPFDKYAHKILKGMKESLLNKLSLYKLNNYYPDVIFLEWTTIILMIDDIKHIFPKAKIIGSEYDVSFQGSFRRLKQRKNILEKAIQKYQYTLLKYRELESLHKCNLVIVQNEKDYKILKENGIGEDRLFRITPFYEQNVVLKRKINKNNIVFFGAMDREENYLSVIWFIEHVFTKILDYNKNCIFWVVGNKPSSIIKKYESSNIKITGYVDNETLHKILESSLCLFAPLVLGSGIKVKILEAFSYGIPVVTNSIGIEGIPARNGVDYIHCESPEEYLNAYINLLDDSYNSFIGNNGNKFVSDTFDLNKSFIEYFSVVKELSKA